jgi:aminopeptidase N
MSRLLLLLLTLTLPSQALAELPWEPQNYMKIKRAFFERERAPGRGLPLQLPGATALYDNGPKGQYDIEHIAAEIMVQPGKNDVTVFADVTLRVVADELDVLYFDYAHPKVLWAQLMDGTPLEFASNATTDTLKITPDHGLVKDEIFTFRMAGAGPLNCSADMLTACGFETPITYVTHSKFYPTNANVSDLYTATLRVVVPDHEHVAAATGVFQGVEEIGEARVFTFETPYASSWISFAVAPYVTVTDDPSGLPITVYTLEEVKSGGANMIPIIDQVLSLYGEAFTPYPFDKLDAIQIGNSFGGGYGPQSSIFMLAYVFGVPAEKVMGSFVSELIAHELGHQWWGNLIEIWRADSIILSEGLAEFSSCLFDEHVTDRRRQFVSNGLIYQYYVPADQDVPITSGQVFGSDYYTVIAYEKGSFIMDMLRHEIGEEIFFDMMHTFFDRYAFQYAAIPDLMATAEEISGQDLGWFTEQWLDGTGHPRMTVTAARVDAGEVALTFTQTQEQGPFQFTLPIQVVASGGDPEREDRVFIDAPEATVKIEHEGTLLAVRPDPDRRLLRRFELTDPADVSLDGEVSGLDVLRFAQGYRRNLLHNYEGDQFFYPDPAYNGMIDLERDGLVNQKDWALFAEAFEGK